MYTMDRGLRGTDDDLYLDSFEPIEIDLHQKAAIEAQENGNIQRAREHYTTALDEIEEYREQVTYVKEKAELDQEDNEILEEIIEDLDELEQGVQSQLDRIH